MPKELRYKLTVEYPDGTVGSSVYRNYSTAESAGRALYEDFYFRGEPGQTKYFVTGVYMEKDEVSR